MSWMKHAPQTKNRARRTHRRGLPGVETLDRRVMLAVTASISAGLLRVTGDEQDNGITISRDAGGTILVNDGAVPIAGGTATIANTTRLHIVGADGNDNISLDQTNGALPGADLFGGAGNDTLVGGSGEDFADGEAGSDTVLLGASSDTFQWNPGDGSDVVDGQNGNDSIVFNGADVAEKFDLSDSGTGLPFHRVRLTRDIGSVSMDLSGLEEIDLNANGGADTITVNDQTATDIVTVNLDLGGLGFGDAAVDAVILNGTNGDDFGQIADFGAFIGANASFFPFVNITGAEGANDTLTLNALDGNDEVDASPLPAGLINLNVNGGAGNDTITGSVGDDSVTGGAGDDLAQLGDGNDTFVWNSGDGSDIVEGQAGTDTLIFSGASANENIDIASNGSRVRVTGDVGNVILDIDGIEQASFAPLGGADNIVVNDLTGTALTHIKVKLNSDGQPDNVTVNGTSAADTIGVDGDFANGVNVTGLHAQVGVIGALGVTDGLTVNALGSADIVDASTLAPGAINLVLNGDAGNDSITSSEGNDRIDGGTDTDTINVIGTASGGVVTLLPNSGDDTVNVNTDGIGFASVVFDATQRIGALNIGSGGVATLTSGGANVLVVTSLSIAGTGKLNLSDNDLIIDYSGASPIAAIKALLASGFHNGAWNGNGINSSSAAATPGTALAFAEATDIFSAFPASFDAQTIDGSSLLLQYTRAADANLDQKVNALDFNSLASNFGNGFRNWVQGDFNFDGVVNTLDFNSLAINFNAPPVSSAVAVPIQPDASPAAATSTLRTLFSTRTIGAGGFVGLATDVS